jgi:hypothetical protein
VAGCDAQHQQTAFAKRKRQDAVFRVKTAPRASADPGSLSTIAWQDAMRSTSKLRLPSENGRMPCFA